MVTPAGPLLSALGTMANSMGSYLKPCQAGCRLGVGGLVGRGAMRVGREQSELSEARRFGVEIPALLLLG